MSFTSEHPNPSAGAIWCVVVAGGSGVRFGQPKQYLNLGGQRVIDRSLATAREACDGVVLVAPVGDVSVESERQGSEISVVAGGTTRSESVRCGLAAVPSDASVILIHDAARPLATVDLYRRVIEAVTHGASAVIPVVAVVDTLRSTDGTPIDRDNVRGVQTPQGFDAAIIRAAHASGSEATDDASLVEAIGHAVTFVDGERANLKITERVDLLIAEALIGAQQ